jgi:hypothetical protein
VKGKTRRVNASEPLLMSRNREPRKVGCGSGVQDQPLERGRRWPTDPSPAREHRRSRDIGGAHPGRVLLVWNTATPLGSGHGDVSGALTVRKADHPAGTGWPKKPMPAAERQQETGTVLVGSFADGSG